MEFLSSGRGRPRPSVHASESAAAAKYVAVVCDVTPRRRGDVARSLKGMFLVSLLNDNAILRNQPSQAEYLLANKRLEEK